MKRCCFYYLGIVQLLSCLSEPESGAARLRKTLARHDYTLQISGLEQVPSLRVLMLGKNLVERVERLDCLTKLDVLDLHCNQLRTIEGLVGPGRPA